MILTVHDGKLVVMNGSDNVVAVVTSVEEFNALAEANGGSMLVSSSVDFPEESTSDPVVIALANAIRGL